MLWALHEDVCPEAARETALTLHVCARRSARPGRCARESARARILHEENLPELENDIILAGTALGVCVCVFV